MTEAKKVNLAGRKLFIAIPTYDGKLNIKTAYNLAQLAGMAASHGISVYFGHLSGCSIITVARNALVREFMNTDCTDLLFIDSDVIVGAGDVLRLLAQSTDKDVAAGLYPRRSMDKNFFVDIPRDENGDMIFDGSMLKVNRIGTGFMMIKREVFEKLAETVPTYTNDVNDLAGNLKADEIKEQQRQAANVPAADPQSEHPEFTQWRQSNPWYNKDSLHYQH